MRLCVAPHKRSPSRTPYGRRPTARDAGKSISYKVGLIDAALAQIVTSNESVSARDQVAVTESEQHIHTALERFRERTQLLTDLAARSSAASQSIRDDVYEALAQLRFHDRASQLLQQVFTSITAAQQQGAGPS